MDIKYINSTKDKLSLIPKVHGQIIYITDALESDNEIYVDFLDSTSQTVKRYGMTQKNDSQVPLSSIMHIGGGTQTNVAEAITALKDNILTTPVPISQGGTGNTDGYIRTGRKLNTTIGTYATAEGYSTTASGNYAHAEGYDTEASGAFSHAEGRGATASGLYSHVEGYCTTADGDISHAEGYFTRANYAHQHVGGQYNDNKSNTLFEVGNGTSDSDRSNAFEVYSNGDINVNGNIRINGSIMPIGGGVTSFNGRTGDISPANGDYTAEQVTYSGNTTVKSKIDEVAGVWTTPVSCAVGDTSVTISNSAIQTTSIIRVLSQRTNGKPLAWTSLVATTGQVVITFTKALTEATDVRLQIINL